LRIITLIRTQDFHSALNCHCEVLLLRRSSCRYQSCAKDTRQLRMRMREIAHVRRRFDCIAAARAPDVCDPGQRRTTARTAPRPTRWCRRTIGATYFVASSAFFTTFFFALPAFFLAFRAIR
jgi:hypothetical protein